MYMKDVEEEFRAYHAEVKAGRGMYGRQVVLLEADETLQGDRRFNATIDEKSKSIVGYSQCAWLQSQRGAIRG